MPIWSHVNSGDHLRRRAESLIQASRKNAKGSAAANGSVGMRSARRMEMLNDLRQNAELSAMSGYGRRRG